MKQRIRTLYEKRKKTGFFEEDIMLKQEGKVKNFYLLIINIHSMEKTMIYIKNIDPYVENERNLQNELNEKNEYLKSKDLFIANLSHEVRTPMNIIIGMVYFLKSTQLDEGQLGYINKLEEASNLLLEIVNNILALSNNNKYNVLTKETDFNLKDLFRDLNDIFEDKIRAKDLKWYMECNIDDDMIIHTDRTRFSQIFVNLINNSIKYTDKGYIELDIRNVEETSTTYKLQFCIKDTGRGIKKEDTLKIFKEFSQVDDPSTITESGSGMGLAITKKIIEDMDGKIWVESNYGLGSKFYFYIRVNKGTKAKENMPKEPEYISAPKNENGKEECICVNKDHVLVVEDNQINIEITKKILEEISLKCDVANNGIEAIKKVEEVGKDYYGIILMDIHMPKYNGYEISKILRKDMGVEIPIIALTATNITDEIIEANKEYITSYIQKPIKPIEFKQKIKEQLCMKKEEHYHFKFIDNYQELLQRIDNNVELEEKLIKILYHDYMDIHERISQKQGEDLYLYIHSLKGALGNLGCNKMYKQLEEIEKKIEDNSYQESLKEFLNEFDKALQEIRDSQVVKMNKKILFVSNDVEKIEKTKQYIGKVFDLIVSNNLKEISILLEANRVDLILIDEFDSIDTIVELINYIKTNYKKTPIILMNEKQNEELKAKTLDRKIDLYVESKYDPKNMLWYIQNAINKNEEEEKLKENLTKTNTEMGNLYGFLFDSLVNLTSLKSKETGGHLLRTKNYMKVMLKKYEEFYKEGLFVKEETIENISIAATLHDIGKVGIPDNILNKPGRLTDEEYEIMKTHTTIGRESLESTYSDKISNEVLEYAKDITLHHHEKYNGAGYPEGLKGDQITIVSKIMALIDVYDALANERIYKPAMQPKEVEDYIISQTNIAFDPKVVNIFIMVKDEFVKINHENAE